MRKQLRFLESEKDQILDLFSIYENVTETAKDFCSVNDLEYNENMRKAISKLINRKDLSVSKIPLEKTPEFQKASTRNLKKSKYYLITYEQNGTPLHKEFYKNLLAYKDRLGGELSVILGRYQNPTSIFSKSKDLWNKETQPYWDAKRQDIHPFLTILGDIKVQPTAVNPLTGFEMITQSKTAIIGHPKMHLRPTAVLEHHPKKILLTTGACTVPNYTDTKAGKKAEAHHKLGFVIVEIKNDKTFFIRQVEATKEGSFTDLIYNVNKGKVKRIKKAKAITWGDTHVGSLDPEKEAGTNSLQLTLSVNTEIHHDITDGHSVNNHLTKDPLGQYYRHIEGKDNVVYEIERVKQFLDKAKKRKVKNVIIPAANHNDRFDRWLNSNDWKKDIPNAKAYNQYLSIMMDITKDTSKGILAYLLEEEFPDLVTTLHPNDSHMIGPVEYSQHGHIGANGSRGSFNQFAKSNIPMTTAHCHTPIRYNDVMSAGTSTFLREGYNKGMSSWLHADVLHHEDDTRQHIIYIDGEFTTFKL